MKKPWVVLAVACLIGLGAAGWALSGNAMASGIRGTADNITESGMNVNGKTVFIDTNTKIDGILVNGAMVKVKTRKGEQGLVATSIQVTEPAADRQNEEVESESEGENENEAENTESLENEISGAVTSYSSGTLVVDGKTIIVNNSARIEGEVRVGASVEVEAQTQPDGTLLAVRIEVEDEEVAGQQEQKHREEADDDDEADEQGLPPASIPQPPPPPANSTPISFSAVIQPIISQNCVTCHSNMATHSGLMGYVNPGNPGSSALYRAIAGGSMPRGGSLSSTQIQAIADWISQGAANN